MKQPEGSVWSQAKRDGASENATIAVGIILIAIVAGYLARSDNRAIAIISTTVPAATLWQS